MLWRIPADTHEQRIGRWPLPDNRRATSQTIANSPITIACSAPPTRCWPASSMSPRAPSTTGSPPTPPSPTRCTGAAPSPTPWSSAPCSSGPRVLATRSPAPRSTRARSARSPTRCPTRPTPRPACSGCATANASTGRPRRRRRRRSTTTWWRCSMPPGRACAMPAIELNMAIACGNCGNWFPPFPPVRSLRFDAGDLHILRPLGAFLAVLRGALLEAERLGVERELVDQPVVDRGRGDGFVDQRVQLLLDRPGRGLGHGDRQEAGEGLAEGRQLGIERAALRQSDGERPCLVGHHLAAAGGEVDEHELDGAG